MGGLQDTLILVKSSWTIFKLIKAEVTVEGVDKGMNLKGSYVLYRSFNQCTPSIIILAVATDGLSLATVHV